MEETNFIRPALTDIDQECFTGIPALEAAMIGSYSVDTDKTHQAQATSPRPSTSAETTTYTKTTYFQRIRLFRTQDLKKKIKLKSMILRPLKFFSFPVVVFNGFMYGAVICYFNVLNGTASLIFSSPPYGFRSSMVGLTYVACVIGVALGYVLLDPN